METLLLAGSARHKPPAVGVSTCRPASTVVLYKCTSAGVTGDSPLYYILHGLQETPAPTAGASSLVRLTAAAPLSY